MPYKDREKENEAKRRYYEKHKEEKKAYQKKNQDKINKRAKEYRDDKTRNAYDSITSKTIIDRQKWDQWCDQIKTVAAIKKHPYSTDFTNDVIFDLMTHGCYYCGDIATTIDRLDSILDHIPENCVGCCGPCNNSKGTADPSTFIRKSYYKARGEYIDNVTDIWFKNKMKPSLFEYKNRANKKKVSFELSKEKFEEMIVDTCVYCHRKPITWFGIDRVVPESGYVVDNVVTCCFDCNLDKHTRDADTTMMRNERIATRVDDGVLIIKERPRVILHKGTQKSAKKVCVYCKVYSNQKDASRAIKKNDNYVSNCIRLGRYSNDMFTISDEFYDFAIKNNLENITKKMYILFDRM
jgi:5-methylcytosine-specific restriction endonuclease McrA